MIMDKKILDKILNISEQFFGTVNDPEQIPITEGSNFKLHKLHPKSFIYKLENGEPISWVVVVPTSKELMDKFLRSEISEKELLDMSEPQKEYGALYLCAAFTVPEYRRKGYAVEMFEEAVNSIPHTADADLFTWPVSPEGEKMIERLQLILKRNILVKK